MKKIIKNILRIGLVVVLSVAAYFQLEKNKEKIETDAKLTQQRNDVIPVITDTARMAAIDNSFEVVGNFAPYKQVMVNCEVAGKARKVYFENGSFVREGATLVAVDNDLLKIKLKTLQTNLAKAENDKNRLQNLLGDGGITQQQLDDARLGIDNLLSEIESVEKQISMTYVKAPISGTISNKMVEKGTLVVPSMQLARITNISRLKMQAYLTEEQVVTIRKGDRINLIADIFPDRKIEGKISFIDVNAGVGKRFLVEIEIPNRENKIRAGMTGTAYFADDNQTEVLAIPRESIVGDMQNAKVYIIEDDIAMIREINVGSVFNNMVHVKDGLTEGETIVVSGQINLENGMRISRNGIN